MVVTTVNGGVAIEQPQELYMLSKRDQLEKDRLDQQSNIIKIVRGGHVLDPSIPKDKATRIADIATGTGVWLREVAAELAESGYKYPLETVGFDISADQFPKNHSPGSKFLVWDATTSFPEEYQGSFDVVHVRLLTVAVTVEQINIITKHLVELIRPGGYLQWTDWTYTNGWEVIYPVNQGGLSLEKEGAMMYKYHGESGFSYDTTGDVAKALETLPIDKVSLTDHTGASRRRPEIRGLVAEWHSRVIPLFMEMMSFRQGQTKEEAAATAESYRQKVIEMGKRGTIFEVPITTLVAQKKE